MVIDILDQAEHEKAADPLVLCEEKVLDVRIGRLRVRHSCGLGRCCLGERREESYNSGPTSSSRSSAPGTDDLMSVPEVEDGGDEEKGRRSKERGIEKVEAGIQSEWLASIHVRRLLGLLRLRLDSLCGGVARRLGLGHDDDGDTMRLRGMDADGAEDTIADGVDTGSRC